MCITAEAEWARAALNLHHALSALADPAPPRDPAASRMQNPISPPQPSSQPTAVMPNASVGLPPTAEHAQSQIQQGRVDQPGSSAQQGAVQQGRAQQDTADPPGSSAQRAQQAHMHSTPNIPAVAVDGTGATSPGAAAADATAAEDNVRADLHAGAAHAPSTTGAAANTAPETYIRQADNINSGSGHIAPSVGDTRVREKNNNGQVASEAVRGAAASEAFHFAYDLLGSLRHTCPLLSYNLLCDGPPFEQHICHRGILLHEVTPRKSLLSQKSQRCALAMLRNWLLRCRLQATLRLVNHGCLSSLWCLESSTLPRSLARRFLCLHPLLLATPAR